MADILRALGRPEANPKIPELRPGDTVRVHSRIVEGERERVQVFQGVLIRLHGGGTDGSFTVRRVAAHGVGVERTFPMLSPRVEKVEVLRHGRARRAKLYFLRGRRGKATRLRERREQKAKQGPSAAEVESQA